ncbi:MAG: His-Xaa-Ser system protein HxsD [Muribaculaceae bacterium]|nr:His-Xaa-Ser system protein HxsD [Muribaculaceae bacterium]
MKVTVDRRIYPESVISKAVYSLCDRYSIARMLASEHFEELEAPGAGPSFEADLLQALNDYKLRQIIADETRDVKTILYAAAFGGDDTFSADDVQD